LDARRSEAGPNFWKVDRKIGRGRSNARSSRYGHVSSGSAGSTQEDALIDVVNVCFAFHPARSHVMYASVASTPSRHRSSNNLKASDLCFSSRGASGMREGTPWSLGCTPSPHRITRANYQQSLHSSPHRFTECSGMCRVASRAPISARSDQDPANEKATLAIGVWGGLVTVMINPLPKAFP
jgi:hypothetical protein